MKKIILALGIFCSANQLAAQTEKQINPPNVEATYTTGSEDLMKFIQTNLKYPKGKKMDGKVYVEFQILADGTVSEPKILKGMDADFDKSALDVIKKMPKWTAAKDVTGKSVASKMVLPINFKK